VELSPSVVRAAAHFAHINSAILQQPNVRMIVDDGRNHMLVGGKQYDVITTDIIRADQHGAGTLEHFLALPPR
jgi:spermidine synthase